MEVTSLKNGPTVPTQAIELALALEARGLRFEIDGAVLRIRTLSGEMPILSDTERHAIRAAKLHLLAIVAYRAE